MSRAKVIYTDEHPYHITARSINQEWFDVPMDYCFGVFINVMQESIKRHDIRLHAFVLMSNHFHMIVSTPQKNIGNFLCFFMTATSKAIAKKSERINHIYGGRNHKSLIMTSEYYAHCLKYIFRNPLKANICTKVEDYKWSTASNINNKMQNLITPIISGHDEYIPIETNKALEWYNETIPQELESVLQKAMKRATFEAKTSRSTKKKLNLNQWLYDK
jgi:putative transposase